MNEKCDCGCNHEEKVDEPNESNTAKTEPNQKRRPFEIGKVYFIEGKKFVVKKAKDREIVLRYQPK